MLNRIGIPDRDDHYNRGMVPGAHGAHASQWNNTLGSQLRVLSRKQSRRLIVQI
jgi:hypothetical protein